MTSLFNIKGRTLDAIKKAEGDVVKEKIDILPDKFYYEGKPSTAFGNMSYWQMRSYLKEKKKNPNKFMLIRIKLAKGKTVREAYIPDFSEVIYWNDGAYIPDGVSKYYVVDRDVWAYDFHEDICLPITKDMSLSEQVEKILMTFNSFNDANKKKYQKQVADVMDGLKKKITAPVTSEIDTDEIKTILESGNFIDTETSLNPRTLKRTIEAEIVKEAIEAQAVGKWLKILGIVMIIVGAIVFLDFMLDIWHSEIWKAFKKG
jgi:hypothetical protein